MDAETRRTIRLFVRQVGGMQARIDRLERGLRATQLTNSSVENGYIVVHDANGDIRQVIGRQGDGTVTTTDHNAPPPPTPTTPIVTASQLGLTVAWDGGLVGAFRPADLDHVEVHLSEISGFTPGLGTVQGTLAKAGSLSVTPLEVAAHYAVLVAVNTSGAHSEPSTEASGTPLEVVSTDILDGIVTTVKLADDAVTEAKIAADAVGTGEIQGQAVELSKLADGSVDATKLIDDAVTSDAIAVGAIGANELAANSVIAGKIAADAVEAGNLAAQSVQAGNIAAEAVQAGDITADAVTATEIAALAITSDELAANSVIAGKIAAGAIEAGDIQADAVTATEIAVDAIATDMIQAGAITSGKIAADAISADQISSGAITSDELSLGSGPGTNILPDPSFEGTLDPAWIDGGDWHMGSYRIRTGSQSLVAEFSSTTNVDANCWIMDMAGLPVDAGSFLFSAWTVGRQEGPGYVESRSYAYIGLRFYDASQIALSPDIRAKVDPGAGAESDNFRRAIGRCQIPQLAAYVRAYVSQSAQVADPNLHFFVYFDDASVSVADTSILFDTSGQHIVTNTNLSNDPDVAAFTLGTPLGGRLAFDSNEIRCFQPDNTVGNFFINGEAVASKASQGPVVRFNGQTQTQWRKFDSSPSGGNTSLVLGSSALFCQSAAASGSGRVDIHASGFVNDSDPNVKENVTDMPFDALDAVNAAPVKEWSYTYDTDGRRHFGPMSDTLPTGLVIQPDDTGKITIFYADDEPVTPKVSDLWLTLATPALFFRVEGNWMPVDNPQAVRALTTARAEGDADALILIQETEPPIGDEGDLWARSSDNMSFRSDGSSWTRLGEIATSVVAELRDFRMGFLAMNTTIAVDIRDLLGTLWESVRQLSAKVGALAPAEGKTGHA
ncbi:MAG: tail fiber domain-containing protein [Nocardioidaceae bacterium]